MLASYKQPQPTNPPHLYPTPATPEPSQAVSAGARLSAHLTATTGGKVAFNPMVAVSGRGSISIRGTRLTVVEGVVLARLV